jgi:putative ABC transport system permease protein
MRLFDPDQWQEIFSTLKNNKLRTFLTAFGVFWGIFMLIIMLGSGKGLENGVTQNFGNMATNALFLWTQRTTIPYKGFPRGRFFNLNNEDIQALKDNIPEIDIIAPRNQWGGYRGSNNVVRGKHVGAFSVFGDYPEFIHINNLKIMEGRFLNNLDIRDKRKVAIIGLRVKESLFDAGENPVGDYIRVNGVYFMVAGVFTSEKGGERGERETQAVYIPFTTFQHAFNFGNRVGWISITSKADVPVSLMEEKVLGLLAERHNIHPKDEHAFGHHNIGKEFQKMNRLFSGIRRLIWVVGIGTLLAGIIGVSNIMLIIVRERTKEIGIRRAIGATPASIISQIISESIFLTSFSGYFGLIAGIAALEIVNYRLMASGTQSATFAEPGVDLSVALTALAILIGTGILAGLFPARRAVSIKPVDAIRQE